MRSCKIINRAQIRWAEHIHTSMEPSGMGDGVGECDQIETKFLTEEKTYFSWALCYKYVLRSKDSFTKANAEMVEVVNKKFQTTIGASIKYKVG